MSASIRAEKFATEVAKACWGAVNVPPPLSTAATAIAHRTAGAGLVLLALSCTPQEGADTDTDAGSSESSSDGLDSAPSSGSESSAGETGSDSMPTDGTGATCGDELVEGTEQCDDGRNGDDDDGCTDECQLSGCGDGIVQPSEECDDEGPSADCSDACTSKGWGSPRAISAPSSFMEQLQLDVSVNGDAVGVWFVGDRVISNRYDRDRRAWLEESVLVHEAPSNLSLWTLGTQLDVAMDSAGDAIAVWNAVLVAAQRGDIYAARYDAAAQTWGPTTLLEHDVHPLTADAPRVEMDPLGNAVAVWRQYGDVRVTTRSNRYDSDRAVWLGEMPLESKTAKPVWDSGLPHIAMNDRGDAAVAWGRNVSGSDLSVRRYFSASALWTPVEVPSSSGGSAPMIALDSHGNTTTIWSQRGNFPPTRVYAARFDARAGAWDEPVRLHTSGGTVSLRDAIATDEAGNVAALWVDRESEDDDGPFSVRTVRYDVDEGVWGPAQLLEVDDESTAREVSIALDAAGGGFAMWVLDGPDSREIHVSRFLSETAVWGSATVLTTDDTKTIRDLQLGTGRAADGVALWSQFDDEGDRVVWASHYE